MTDNVTPKKTVALDPIDVERLDQYRHSTDDLRPSSSYADAIRHLLDDVDTFAEAEDYKDAIERSALA